MIIYLILEADQEREELLKWAFNRFEEKFEYFSKTFHGKPFPLTPGVLLGTVLHFYWRIYKLGLEDSE